MIKIHKQNSKSIKAIGNAMLIMIPPLNVGFYHENTL